MGHQPFPAHFFDRVDPTPDAEFYGPDRFVTHIDDGAIAAVSDLYDELEVGGHVLDLMSSWVSHLRRPPVSLTVLGMNARELAANPQATAVAVHDLNVDPVLPFGEGRFDAVLCCVSVDYLVRPVEVFAEAARVLRPGRPFICTFSNRLFPTKAIKGWLGAGESQRLEIVAEYFRRAGGWEPPVAERRTPPGHVGDPLDTVWARRAS